MAADAEFSLTIDGTERSDLVYDWGSVQWADSHDGYASLQFTLRQAFGEAAVVSTYSVVRLVNLYTGVPVFEGVVAAGPRPRRVVDPTWIETDVSCLDPLSLLETSTLQVAVDFTDAPTFYVRDWIAALIRASFADARFPMLPITEYQVAGVDARSYLDATFAPVTIAQYTPTMQAIQSVMEGALSEEFDAPNGLGGTSWHERDHVLKWVPGQGLVLTPSSVAFRGAAPVQLTAAGGYAPARAAAVEDTTTVATAVVATGADSATPPSWKRIVQDPAGRSATNGFLVIRDDWTMPWANGAGDADADVWATYAASHAPSAYDDVQGPSLLPYDLAVGQTLTYFPPGQAVASSGVIGSVSTTLNGGATDTTSRSAPYLLDGSRSFDGTWTLDATATTSAPRRYRNTKVTVAGTPKTFVANLRHTKSISGVKR